MRISLDRYHFKIKSMQKVNRCKPRVSNETELSKSFLYKFSPCTKHNWLCIIGFLINTAPLNVIFILRCHLFFCKKFFFESLYFSEYDIWMFLFVFVLRIGHPLSKYATGGMERGSSKMCTGACRGRGSKNKSWDTYVLNEWPAHRQQGKCCFLPS